MPEMDYVLYDTAAFGNAANTEHLLFQVAQGGDATHTESFTNSRGAGQIPNEETMVIEEIAVTVVTNQATPSDYQNVWIASFLEIKIADFSWGKFPLALLARANSYGGHYSQAAAADDAMIGLQGKGLQLKRPITLKGGTSFKVRVFQGTALGGASRNVLISLIGVLNMP